jgi:uncharacterized delta-60 repeat protein
MFIRTIRRSISAALLTLCACTLFAQPGSLDTDFATAGKFIQDLGFQDNLTKVTVQPADQKIVAVGTALSQAFAGQLLVVRLHADGTPDTDFSDDGVVLITDFNESYAYDVHILDDGKILVAGSRADEFFQFSMLVLRLNPDGSLDTDFGTNGFATPEISTADDFAQAMVVLDDGRILLAGKALDANFRNRPVVVRLSNTGELDTSFGVDGVAGVAVEAEDNNFWSLALQSDGSIVASGHYDQGLTVTGQFDQDILIARFTAEGALDNGFGTNGTVVRPISAEYNERAFAMAITPTDDILVSGYTTQLDFSFDAVLLKYDADGAPVTGFGTNGLVVFDNAIQDVAYGMVLQSDDKILVCGTSGGFFFDPRDQLVARYLPNGTLDTDFGTDGFVLNNIAAQFDEANALTLQADGKIVVAGKGNSGTNNDITIFRHLNDLGTGLVHRSISTDMVVSPNPVNAGGTVRFSLPGGMEGSLQLQLVDALGRRTIVLPVGQGVMQAVLPSDLRSGAYTAQVFANGSVVARVRLVVQQ